jgi:hypothetical protein
MQRVSPWKVGAMAVIALDTIVSIEPPIHATDEVAGLVYRIVLPTGPATIVLPLNARNADILNPGPPSEWPTFPGQVLPPVLRPVGLRVTAGTALVPSEHQLNIEAMRCRLSVEESAIDTFAPGIKVGAAFGEWLRRARQWIEAWNGTPQSDLTRVLEPFMEGVYRKGGQWVRVGLGGGPRQAFFPGHPLIRPPELLAAFDAASAGIDLPLQQRTWETANTYWYLEDYRSCTIDACCAAEVALTSAVIQVLTQDRGLTAEKAERFVDGAHGVVDIFRLYMAARGSAVSEGRVKADLAGPRNKAAHEGDELSVDEAKAALSIAREIVAEATPLPTSADVRRRARQALAARWR